MSQVFKVMNQSLINGDTQKRFEPDLNQSFVPAMESQASLCKRTHLNSENFFKWEHYGLPRPNIVERNLRKLKFTLEVNC